MTGLVGRPSRPSRMMVSPLVTWLVRLPMPKTAGMRRLWAMMAVCEVREVPFATAVCISDVLSETGWEALFTAPPVRDALDALWDAAVATLTH